MHPNYCQLLCLSISKRGAMFEKPCTHPAPLPVFCTLSHPAPLPAKIRFRLSRLAQSFGRAQTIVGRLLTPTGRIAAPLKSIAVLLRRRVAGTSRRANNVFAHANFSDRGVQGAMFFYLPLRLCIEGAFTLCPEGAECGVAIDKIKKIVFIWFSPHLFVPLSSEQKT